jgi:tetratricopeptide (TPR) repeat protein
MRKQIAQMQNIRRGLTLLVLGALAAAAFPSFAELHARDRAHVFLRDLSHCHRIIFSWDSHEKVPFTIHESGNTVTLHFEKPVLLAWGSALEDSQQFMNKPATADGGATYILTLRAPYRAHYFIDDGKYGELRDKNGIDFIASKRTTPIATLEIPENATPKHLSVAADEDDGDSNDMPTPKKHAHTKTHMVAKVEKEKHVQLTSDSPSSVVVKKAPMQSADASALAALSPSAGEPSSHSPAPKAAPAAATQTTAPRQTSDLAPPLPIAKIAAPAVTIPPKPAAPSPAVEPIAAAKPDAQTVLDLDIVEGDPFAIFAHRGSLWVVTDPAERIEKDNFSHTPAIEHVQSLPSPNAKVFYMTLANNDSASVKRLSPEMVRLTLQRQAPPPSDPLYASLRTDKSNQYLFTIPAAKAGHIVSLEDPTTGEPLFIVPYVKAGTGITNARSLVQFSLLQTAQGVAIEKKMDNLNVAINSNMLEISATGGLTISQEVAQQAQDAETDAINARLPATLFPYARWKLSDEKNFVSTQVKLFHQIAFDTEDTSNKARLKLLDLYLAEGMFQEAHGMASDILRSNYGFWRANNVAALRGAANFFMYRIVEAERDFSSPELKNNPEAAMWLSLCKELLGQPGTPFNFTGNYDHTIQYYPPTFIQKLAIIAADRAITRKDYDTAMNIFDDLKKDDLDEPVEKYIDFMHAKIESETGEEDDAAKIWEKQAADIDDPLIRARAEFSLVNMLLRQDRITHDDAKQRLDRLRAVWRGDNLEVNVLTLLSNLQLEDKEYGKALHTMRDIVLYYPQVPEALTTAEKMEQTFIMLFNKGGADNMQPLEALALFYEFRDLVPSGPEGDLMVRNLADRLVNIDLLDRAAELLNHQISKRLEGEERSKVGARLALIYLMNHQPKEALDTLKITGYGNLPSDLQLKRIRLTAQALAQQGQPDKAIDVLSNDNSTDGTFLRLSIYWDNKDWPNVVNTAEEFLGNRNDPSAPLNAQESDVLLKLATAYVYEHDSGQIQYLRDYFTPLLKDNPDKASFLFITSESGTIDYENIANLDQDISEVKSYLDTYRDKVKKNGLSNAL